MLRAAGRRQAAAIARRDADTSQFIAFVRLVSASRRAIVTARCASRQQRSVRSRERSKLPHKCRTGPETRVGSPVVLDGMDLTGAQWAERRPRDSPHRRAWEWQLVNYPGMVQPACARMLRRAITPCPLFLCSSVVSLSSATSVSIHLHPSPSVSAPYTRRVSISAAGVISQIVRVPQPTIASRSSLLRMSSTRSTPGWPKLASPQM